MSNTEQAVVIYKRHATLSSIAPRSAQQWFERDLKKRQQDGWRLVSVNPTGQDALRKPILTAIYEREKRG